MTVVLGQIDPEAAASLARAHIALDACAVLLAAMRGATPLYIPTPEEALDAQLP